MRPAAAADIPALGAIAENAGFFRAEYLPDIIAPGLGDAPETWRVAVDRTPIGFASARPEKMTDRVWNILALGVLESARGSGHATGLLHEMEGALDAPMILIETTQRPEQAAARAFYEKEGYTRVATLARHFSDGADKIVSAKRMAA